MVKNKTRQKPANAWVSLCLVTKQLANWGELLRVSYRFDSGWGCHKSGERALAAFFISPAAALLSQRKGASFLFAPEGPVQSKALVKLR